MELQMRPAWTSGCCWLAAFCYQQQLMARVDECACVCSCVMVPRKPLARLSFCCTPLYLQ